MKATIQSTSKIVQLDGIPARLWEGQTESGIGIVCFITRVAIKNGEPSEEFERELQQQSTPSAEVMQFPISLIL